MFKKTKKEKTPESRKQKSGTGKGKRGKNTRTMDVTDEDALFREKLEAENLEIIDMAADGNCLFRALSDQLYGDYGKLHQQVRKDICDYMQENEDDFKLFLVLDDDSCDEGDDGKDFESYMAMMRRDAEWGGNLELVAAARLHQRKITVFSETMSAYTIEPGDEKPCGPDLLVSFHDNDHYNSIRDKKSTKKTIYRPERAAQFRESSSTTASATTTSASELSTSASANSTISRASKKPPKKNAVCPCGTGKRYKKCCLAKEKHAIRIGKMQMEEPTGDNETTNRRKPANAMGSFQVLQI